MIKNEFIYNVYVDLYRKLGKANLKVLIKEYFFKPTSTIKLLVNIRLCNYIYKSKTNLLNKILLKIMFTKLLFLQRKYGIEISYKSNIGEGLLLPHYGGIVIHENVVIGKNCSILHGVTIGINMFKSRKEVAIIGDNVTINAGAKIIGNIKIGNNVTIGANSVVNKDLPDNCVAAGIPAKVISYKKAIIINDDYITN